MNKDLLKLLLAAVADDSGQEQNEKGGTKDHPFVVGEKYFIRAVTYHTLGKLKEIRGNFLVFENASWVADSGTFSKAIKNGTLAEVEHLGQDWIVNMDSIVDAGIWSHELPAETK